jgi:predicted 2-oxoglutarate/Fe(II)-dependent dioxygenase YbiX/peroxiredoxin
MPEYRMLGLGEPAPWFTQRNTSNPVYSFDSVAGRYIVLCFFGSANNELGLAALSVITSHRNIFDDERVSFFGVSIDPEDELENRVKESMPGIRHFWDADGKVSRLYGSLPISAEEVRQEVVRLWVVLDPGLHVIARIPMTQDGFDRITLIDFLTNLPPVSHYGGMEMHAPVIILPNVFESSLCQQLIDIYLNNGGEVSGVMRELDGKTIGTQDNNFKRRYDCNIENDQLKHLLQRRIKQKIVPMIQKVHCFQITRMERYIVACYDSENSGFFRAHRDNTTKGTAHRRFAVSINLNQDFEGGELTFPEYGPRTYKIPTGCAVVFSGSLLHAVTPVRKGRRYAFLPFLYDDAAAALRERNNPYLATGVEEYKSFVSQEKK